MKKIIYSLSLLLFFSACKDSELDVSPSDSLSSKSAITSIDDLNAAVLGVYDKMTVETYYDGIYLTAGDMLGDDALSPYSGSGWLDTYSDYSWTKIACPSGFYKHIYELVAGINDVLERSKTLKESPAKTKLIAEMKALRAIAHFDLSKLYGPLPVNLGKGNIKADALCIPIMDELKPIKEPETMLRRPVTEVYDFIVKELEAALPELETGKIEGRLGQDGVTAALARVYLYMGNNEKAFEYADKIIKNKAYALIPKDKYVDSWKKAYTSEAIFELDVTLDDNNGINSIGYYVLAEGTQGYKDISSSPHFDELKTQNPEDERFKLFVWYEDNKGSGFFPTLKYPGRETYAVNNIKVYRLSEMYLIAAEALLKLGRGDEAAALLNALRKERTTTEPEKYTASLTIDDILYERRLELFAEGHRAWDLWRNQKPVVRWRNADEKDKYKYRNDRSEGVVEFDYFKTVLPIHEEQLFLLPPDIREQQQSPGY